MGGGAAIQGMQRSYNSNRNLLKKRKPLSKRKKILNRRAVDISVEKKMSSGEMIDFKRKLRKRKEHDRWVSVAIIAVLITLLAAIIFAIRTV